MEDIIKDFEKMGVIEKCSSKWNSPAILVSKKDTHGIKKDYRFVVDYRKVNEITEMTTSVIPLIEDVFTELGGNEYYSCIDLKNAFYFIEIREDQRDITAFTVGNFQYRFKRMGMGLALSPHTWTRAINLILGSLIGNGIFVYLDDVIIYGKTKKEHDEVLWKVMCLLQKHKLQLNIAKCTFYARVFPYLGHLISKEGSRPNPDKIRILREFLRPVNIRSLQSFLGMANYFRKYVKDFSKIAKPLTQLLKKEQPFIWGDQQKQAFEKLKTALTTEVILSFPDFSDTFYVQTDASQYAIGGVLMQRPGGEYFRPIYYFSRTLSETQQKYSCIERELLAICESVKAFRVYLYGKHFVITNHSPIFSD